MDRGGHIDEYKEKYGTKGLNQTSACKCDGTAA